MLLQDFVEGVDVILRIRNESIWLDSLDKEVLGEGERNLLEGVDVPDIDDMRMSSFDIVIKEDLK
jgi:hypothetical protein